MGNKSDQDSDQSKWLNLHPKVSVDCTCIEEPVDCLKECFAILCSKDLEGKTIQRKNKKSFMIEKQQIYIFRYKKISIVVAI